METEVVKGERLEEAYILASRCREGSSAAPSSRAPNCVPPPPEERICRPRWIVYVLPWPSH